MAKNYTLNCSLSMAASSASGYSQSQSGSYQLNITGVDQIATGRIDVAHDRFRWTSSIIIFTKFYYK